MSTPPLRGTRRSSTGRVARRKRTTTMRGGTGTSLTSKSSSAAIRLGISELSRWADGLANGGGGLQSPLRREPNLVNGRLNAAQEQILYVPSQTWQNRSEDGSKWERRDRS